MKFDELYRLFHQQSWFDLVTIKLFFPEETNAGIRTAVYRFCREGKLLPLRRGLYCFNSPFAKQLPTGPQVANLLLQPSYLSERWALAWYGLIPEKVCLYTSLTPRTTATFANSFGDFHYRSIKQELFTAYSQIVVSGAAVLIASPEKALLDLWYLEAGCWTAARMADWRLAPQGIREAELRKLAALYTAPRMHQAVSAWFEYASNHDEGREIE